MTKTGCFQSCLICDCYLVSTQRMLGVCRHLWPLFQSWRSVLWLLNIIYEPEHLNKETEKRLPYLPRVSDRIGQVLTSKPSQNFSKHYITKAKIAENTNICLIKLHVSIKFPFFRKKGEENLVKSLNIIFESSEYFTSHT